MLQEKIIDLATGQETLREYTAAEIKAVEAEQAKAQALVVEQSEKLASKTAVLQKLGLTADEIAALLG